MAENHLVTDPTVIEPPAEWISRKLGIRVSDPDRVDVLYFERFGSAPSAVILLPQDMAGDLPSANRTITRIPAPSRDSGTTYSPPIRVPRTDIARGEHTTGIERIECDEVSLRLSATRVSGWGVNLDLLKREDGMTISVESFIRWLKINGLPHQNLNSAAAEILHASYAVALTEKLDSSRAFRAPRMPVIHNQRCGVRYRLYFGREKMGSPCDFHILLYQGPRKPVLYGVPATERSTAAERKEGLGLLQTWDKRIRFYQPTDAQWEEWCQARPETNSLPPELRGLVEHAFTAAEELQG